VHPRWLSYWLQGDEFGWQALATKGATDMADYINLRDQRRMRITLPPLDAQRAIAEVLSTIDELIENSRRRVEVLEQTARAIYREWFEHLRYPGHAHTRLVDSPLGPVPEAWSVEVSGELQRSGLLEIGDGYRAKNSEMSHDGIGLPFVRVANVRDGYLDLRAVDRLPPDYAQRLRSKVSRVGDVVISMKGTVGRQALVDERHPRMAYSPQVSFWRSLDWQRVPPCFLYEWIRSDSFEQQCAASKGATAMADYVNLADQRRMRVLLPAAHIVAQFAGEVGTLIESASVLRWQMQQLAGLRDLLLPKLVSGAIDVRSLDLDLELERASA
jgi:type I restriction enzyme S subunit